jgi:phage repressor protein C with HTH and peptisase S24 domain
MPGRAKNLRKSKRRRKHLEKQSTPAVLERHRAARKNAQGNDLPALGVSTAWDAPLVVTNPDQAGSLPATARP